MSQLEPDDEICHESMPSASKKTADLQSGVRWPNFFSVAELGLDQQQQLRILTMPPQVCGYSAW